MNDAALAASGAGTMRTAGQANEADMLVPSAHPRRLTPLECARLQSFPDDWLDVTPKLSDTAKYKLLGNAITVNVSHWIASRMRACWDS